jgi:hypothetical protein
MSKQFSMLIGRQAKTRVSSNALMPRDQLLPRFDVDWIATSLALPTSCKLIPSQHQSIGGLDLLKCAPLFPDTDRKYVWLRINC